jgi:hypothetical protein
MQNDGLKMKITLHFTHLRFSGSSDEKDRLCDWMTFTSTPGARAWVALDYEMF